MDLTCLFLLHFLVMRLLWSQVGSLFAFNMSVLDISPLGLHSLQDDFS